MQSTAGVPRGAVLVITGLAAVALIHHVYYTVYNGAKAVDSGLHRSNAVRRQRRRWRDGVTPQDLDYDPTTRAIENLQRREQNGEGYGVYKNHYYPAAGDDQHILLPSRLLAIRNALTTVYDLSEGRSAALLLHIQACFMRNFLSTEYPTGYLIAPDTQQLLGAMQPYIDADSMQSLMYIWDKGEGMVSDNVSFRPSVEEREQSSRLTNDLGLHTEGARSPTQLAAILANTTFNASAATADGDGHTALDVLYRIAEEQAKRAGYQHRGVECNSCGMQPIQGIRYHCANCWDYDLCEACESQQFHPKTHVFYKIRIPAPTRGQIKIVQPKWYPGNPMGCVDSIPVALKDSIMSLTSLTRQDLDALYDQFKCIASKKINDEIGMAIGKTDFERYFTTSAADRPPKPNELLNRIFCFYDTDKDKLISFSEFAMGMSELAHNTTREARVRRMFWAFDLDGDGFIQRRDFLYLLRAHYDLNKELAHEMIYARDDAILGDEEMLAVINGTNPISATFGGNHFPRNASRHGRGKHLDTYGDMVLDDPDAGVLAEDSLLDGNREEAIARQASESRQVLRAKDVDLDAVDEPLIGTYGSVFVARPVTIRGAAEDTDIDMPDADTATWYDHETVEADVVQALGQPLAFEDVNEPTDRIKVLEAQEERMWKELAKQDQKAVNIALRDRWRRRRFYRDEEEGLSEPPGYPEFDSSDDATAHYGNRPASKSRRRQDSVLSRSSSKVRFHIERDEDAESNSSTASKHTPAKELWDGYEMPPPPRNVGVEMIYEAVQEAFNDMLDHFFKEREDLALDAELTRQQRGQHRYYLARYMEMMKRKRAEIRAMQAAVADGVSLTDPAAPPANQPSAGASSSKLTPDPEDMHDAKDPTLPQFRPDHFDEPQYEVWYKHELLELADRIRGGQGKLSFAEFKQKLRDTDENDIDIGAEGPDTDDNYWEERADLGRFSFLSTWIEMASF